MAYSVTVIQTMRGLHLDLTNTDATVETQSFNQCHCPVIYMGQIYLFVLQQESAIGVFQITNNCFIRPWDDYMNEYNVNC